MDVREGLPRLGACRPVFVFLSPVEHEAQLEGREMSIYGASTVGLTLYTQGASFYCHPTLGGEDYYCQF